MSGFKMGLSGLPITIVPAFKSLYFSVKPILTTYFKKNMIPLQTQTSDLIILVSSNNEGSLFLTLPT